MSFVLVYFSFSAGCDECVRPVGAGTTLAAYVAESQESIRLQESFRVSKIKCLVFSSDSVLVASFYPLFDW